MYRNAYQTKLHIELDCVSLCYDKLQLIQFDSFKGYYTNLRIQALTIF